MLGLRCCSSVVEHSLGKGEAESSILSSSTICCTVITAYLRNGGTLENAAAMANHASTRTTQLCGRRRDDISLDEVERIIL